MDAEIDVLQAPDSPSANPFEPAATDAVSGVWHFLRITSRVRTKS